MVSELQNSNLFLFCRPTFPTFFRTIYFWFSLAFLIMRTLMVSLFASCVNDESKKPIVVLRNVSSNFWKSESKRLYNEIVHNSVALTGLQFFSITRRLVLGMVGTIVTYELVLMQFQLTQKSN